MSNPTATAGFRTMTPAYLSAYATPGLTKVMIGDQVEELWAVVLGPLDARIRTSITGWQRVEHTERIELA